MLFAPGVLQVLVGMETWVWPVLVAILLGRRDWDLWIGITPVLASGSPEVDHEMNVHVQAVLIRKCS